MNDEASMGHSMYGQQIHGPQADGQQRPYPGNAAPQGGMQPPSGPTPPRLKLSWQIWVAVAGVSMVLAMCACAGNLARPSPSPCRSAGEVSCPTPVPTPQDTPTPPDGGAISGMVTWPDGTLAANVRIVLYPLGRLAGYMPEQDMTTDGNGGYSSNICTDIKCTNFQAYLEAPISTGCWIQLQSPAGPAQGFGAMPGQQIDWQVQDTSCSAAGGPYTWQEVRDFLQSHG